MVRKESPKAVTAKMYRHFAVVTLFATGALAIATSESSADQLNSALDEKQANVSASGKALGAKAEPKVVRRMGKANSAPRAAVSGWGTDETIDSGSGGTASSYIPQGIGGKAVSVGMLRQVKLTPEEFLALSAEEQEKVLARLNGGGSTSPAEQARNQQAIAAASLERSGFEGNCSDC